MHRNNSSKMIEKVVEIEVEKPVYYEKIVTVEKEIPVERIVERIVEVERIRSMNIR